MKAFLSQPAKSFLRIERMHIQCLIEPEPVRRRDWSHRRTRMSSEDDTADILAVDGLRDRAAKILGAKPRFLVSRKGGRANLVEPHLLGIQRRTGIMHRRRHLASEAVKAFRVQAINQMDFA